MINVKHTIFITLLLCGCSSPPPPVPVEWEKPGNSVNSTMPQWNDNSIIIPSREVNGKWSAVIRATDFDDMLWTPAVFYAAAHSPRIVISTPSGDNFFKAKSWLRQHGAKGVIEYQPALNCIACSETSIYFSR
ncbi:Cag pathogenicity island protein Cag12 [Salmonella enterica]|uniref:cag pathogenicity island Cag12 family protein n=1 Tax=Enterobacterales TaxID=91347 RepID=UPI000CFBCE08|nr:MULTISPECIES: cag pathogenicity island Cag12 family protein [Enterobacterales]EAQ6188074.1 Cag pathogenicity island protein Cag12 [Salmonella enterica]EFJ4049613.1 Cag pathogenicity island protein Cag12 [Escherichia coli]EKZ5446111.1 cag pathogenicity island Cag12 family protein [Klebsiella aerogenes]ELY6226753.1 cag pathogenicity island Cag12 family protein [Cronobacter muytjensii]ELY6247567.1 cag pathogenicity island Cag12 family protein [Cronobacter universalis]